MPPELHSTRTGSIRLPSGSISAVVHTVVGGSQERGQRTAVIATDSAVEIVNDRSVGSSKIRCCPASMLSFRETLTSTVRSRLHRQPPVAVPWKKRVIGRHNVAPRAIMVYTPGPASIAKSSAVALCRCDGCRAVTALSARRERSAPSAECTDNGCTPTVVCRGYRPWAGRVTTLEHSCISSDRRHDMTSPSLQTGPVLSALAAR